MLSIRLLSRQFCGRRLQQFSQTNAFFSRCSTPNLTQYPREYSKNRAPVSAADFVEKTYSQQDIAANEAYSPPTKGLLSKLPAAWVPYAELMRLDKPAGSIYLFFPCFFGTLLASTYTLTPPLTVLGTSALFATGALIMRGAGCTINDLWDRNLDPHVSRTRLRPIARRAISVPQGITFTGFQMLAGLAVLLQFPPECFWYATPSLALVATYPLAKRVTNYPQAVLGLAFSWGALVSFPALGVDLLSVEHFDAAVAVSMLYASCVSWTVLYDMIYAHMDVEDDVKAGIKSIALRHRDETKAVLAGLGVVQVGLLAGVGGMLSLGPGYFLLSCGGAAATLALMIKRVRLSERASCWWWFSNGVWFTGSAISLGLLEEYVERKWRNSRIEHEATQPRA